MILTIAAGLFNIGLAIFHLLFWRLLGWPRSLAASGALNAAVTQTLNLVLTYVFVVYGAVLLWLGGEAPTVLIAAGAGFWVLRAALQPVTFGLRGRLSWSLLGVFTLGAVIHALAWAASAFATSGLPFSS